MAAKRTPSTSQARDAGSSPDGGLEETINRNFALPKRQAEWLRVTAFEQRTSQAQLVREAIDDLIRKYARRK